jgi:GNAT superfamily N-acetyltransferase
MKIALAQTPAEVERCFPVMHELRPHMGQEQFLQQVQRQQAVGYHMAFLEDDGAIHSVAGYRILESLAWGKALYVDDLVTAQTARSKGYGAALFGWLLKQARENDCGQLHLDSGVQRFDAHRFYLNRGLAIHAHHFAMLVE